MMNLGLFLDSSRYIHLQMCVRQVVDIYYRQRASFVFLFLAFQQDSNPIFSLLTNFFFIAELSETIQLLSVYLPSSREFNFLNQILSTMNTSSKPTAKGILVSNEAHPIPRQGSLYSLTLEELHNTLGDPTKNFGSMHMEELLKNVWTAEESQAMVAAFGSFQNSGDGVISQGSLLGQPSLNLLRTISKRTVDEVWKIIHGDEGTTGIGDLNGFQQRQATFGETTLEDFLARAGVGREEKATSSQTLNGFVGVPNENANKRRDISSDSIGFDVNCNDSVTAQAPFLSFPTSVGKAMQQPTIMNSVRFDGMSKTTQQGREEKATSSQTLNGFVGVPTNDNANKRQDMSRNSIGFDVNCNDSATTHAPIFSFPTSVETAIQLPTIMDSVRFDGMPKTNQQTGWIANQPRVTQANAGAYANTTARLVNGLPSPSLGRGIRGGINKGYGMGCDPGSPQSPMSDYDGTDIYPNRFAMAPSVPYGSIRGRKRGVEGHLDKVIERRHKRMMKNRESAARSRARKQAYTSDLEDEVAYWKEENLQLQKEEEEAEKRKKKILSIMCSVLQQQNNTSQEKPLERTCTVP